MVSTLNFKSVGFTPLLAKVFSFDILTSRAVPSLTTFFDVYLIEWVTNLASSPRHWVIRVLRHILLSRDSSQVPRENAVSVSTSMIYNHIFGNISDKRPIGSSVSPSVQFTKEERAIAVPIKIILPKPARTIIGFCYNIFSGKSLVFIRCKSIHIPMIPRLPLGVNNG